MKLSLLTIKISAPGALIFYFFLLILSLTNWEEGSLWTKKVFVHFLLILFKTWSNHGKNMVFYS